MITALCALLASAGLACDADWGDDPKGFEPAASLAGEMTPEWREFADQVDRACATNFNAGQARTARAVALGRQQGLKEHQLEAMYRFNQAESQQATHDEIASLGPPPERPDLFGPWLANVGHRAELMREDGKAHLAKNRRRSVVTDLRIMAAKIDADWLGQNFGLRICTSNGPSNNLDPADGTYLERVNEVCAGRARQDRALWKQGAFTPNVAAGTSTGETLSISAEAPPIEEYELREQILEIKREIDREQVSRIKRAAKSPDPHDWPAISAGLEDVISEGRDRLAELGLPDCAWPEA